MKRNTFKSNIPHHNCDNGDKICFPFSPPIFQTELDEEFINELLIEGRKLTMEDSYSDKLAGNFKSGRSYIYKDDYIRKKEPQIVKQAENFFNGLYEQHGESYKGVNKIMKLQQGRRADSDGNLKLDTMWINFQHKNDFNPPHTHTGVLSFVIFLHVDNSIFEVQADTNTKDAGKIIFSYGEEMSELIGNQWPVYPYKGLMFMFPARLKHHVPSFWIDNERISVSGNLIVA